MSDTFDLMVDTETLGVNPRAPVTSIGAMVFDPADDSTGETFYHKIDIGSYDTAPGAFLVDFSTIKWVVRQSEDFRGAYAGGADYKTAAALFTEWVGEVARGRRVVVWAQGVDFDIPKLEHLLRVAGLRTPWRFNDKRDTRTLYAVAGYKKPEGRVTTHNALDDCREQIADCRAAYALLKQ